MNNIFFTTNKTDNFTVFEMTHLFLSFEGIQTAFNGMTEKSCVTVSI